MSVDLGLDVSECAHRSQAAHHLLHDVGLHVAVQLGFFFGFGQGQGFVVADVALQQNFGIFDQVFALQGA